MKLRTLAFAAAIVGVSGSVAALRWIIDHDRTFDAPLLVIHDADEEVKRTFIAGALSEPHKAGLSILWCSTFQLAWNELGTVLGGPLSVEGDPALVQRLNTAAESRDDLDDASYVAMAGLGRDGILERIREQLDSKFGGAARARLLPATVQPGEMIAYAYLHKDLAFKEPFVRREEPLRFGAGELRAFGLWNDRRVHNHGELARQIVVHSYTSPADWTVELVTTTPEDRLIIARLTPGATLSETVDRIAGTLGSSKKLEFREEDSLVVPLFNFDITRRYDEVVGKRLTGSKGFGPVLEALQNIRFRLDEKGAKLRSEAYIACGAAIRDPARLMVCDGPFAVVLMRRGAAHPYFAAWVENPELLAAWK